MVRPGRRSDLLSELSDLLAYSGVKSDRRRDDKIDAIRIGEYAFRYADQAQRWQPEREILLELKHLVGLRKRLMLAKETLQVPLKEAIDRGGGPLSRQEVEQANEGS